MLLEYFGSAEKIWKSPERELRDTGLGEKLADRFLDFRKKFSLENYLKTIGQSGIHVITFQDKRYPPLLKEIPDAPFVLYIRGNIELIEALHDTVAVVGTRMITSYGRTITENITGDLVRNGATIVSGMAYGVDTVAHETAIEAGGKTIAVLGCGVDIIHPKSNTTLYWKIVKGAGLVISEFPVGQWAEKGLFPARNRIISGLSRGVLVTEGAKDSGALITARYAAEQGRDVFAVPGPITSSLSEGPTILLKQGAKLVTGAEDILEELRIQKSEFRNQNSDRKTPDNLSSDERKIVDLLGRESMHFDELVRKSGLPAEKLGRLLTMMEVKKFVKNTGNGIYGLHS